MPKTFSRLALSLSLVMGGLGLAAPMAALAKDSTAQIQDRVAQTRITLVQAIEAALVAVPGKAIDAQLDDDQGVVRYEVEVVSTQGHSVEVRVHASSGVAVLHEDDGPAKRKDRQRLDSSKITLQQAIVAAQKHTPGIAIDAQLGSDWGRDAFAVDLLNGQGQQIEVKISPADGAVVRSKVE